MRLESVSVSPGMEILHVCPLKHIWDAVSAFKFFVILLDNYTEEVLDNEVLSSPAPSNNAHTNRCI